MGARAGDGKRSNDLRGAPPQLSPRMLRGPMERGQTECGKEADRSLPPVRAGCHDRRETESQGSEDNPCLSAIVLSVARPRVARGLWLLDRLMFLAPTPALRLLLADLANDPGGGDGRSTPYRKAGTPPMAPSPPPPRCSQGDISGDAWRLAPGPRCRGQKRCSSDANKPWRLGHSCCTKQWGNNASSTTVTFTSPVHARCPRAMSQNG